jgi:hypothetical protein
MEVIYPVVFRIAREKNLPIIDLSNTFDIYDDDLYVAQIEPSHKGGQIITSLVKHIMLSHDWEGSVPRDHRFILLRLV